MTEDKIVQDLSNFKGEKHEIGVGYKFESYEDEDITIQPNDIYHWEDPDAGMHVGECELISTSEYVGRIRGVYAVDYDWIDGYAVEIRAYGVSRINVNDVYVVNRDNDVPEHIKRIAETFRNGEYEKHMNRRYHMGKGGVPEDLWESYQEDDYGNSGLHCEYCTSNKSDISGE